MGHRVLGEGLRPRSPPDHGEGWVAPLATPSCALCALQGGERRRALRVRDEGFGHLSDVSQRRHPALGGEVGGDSLDHRRHRGRAPTRVGGEALADQGVQILRERRIYLPGPLVGGVQQAVEEVGFVAGVERVATRAALVEQNPQREDIGAVIDLRPPPGGELFRRDVAVGPFDHSGPRLVDLGRRLRYTEVDQLHRPVVADHDVGWVEVAMDDVQGAA